MPKPPEPYECLCKRTATGMAIGPAHTPKFLCEDCLPLATELSAVRRFDAYERAALKDAVTRFGERLNGRSLDSLEEEDAEEILASSIREFGNSIRRQLKAGRAPI